METKGNKFGLKKDIEKLEKVIAEAPDELTRLKNELAKYNKNE